MKQLKGKWIVFVDSQVFRVVKEARAIAKELYYHHGKDEHKKFSTASIDDAREFKRRIL